MNSSHPHATLSRIDKLLLDMSAVRPADARARRLSCGARIVVGMDVASSRHLQLMLLTAVNLGFKCFGRATVHADPRLWTAPCLTNVTTAAALAEAITTLGGTLESSGPVNQVGPHLVLGDARVSATSLRITFDGWVAAAGPARELPRMRERPYFPPACIAAAAIGIGELFSAFAGINLLSTRQVVSLPLLSTEQSADPVGLPLIELPAAISVFGLGHLGQAHLWTVAALPYAQPRDLSLWLCDDDQIEEPNIETGALLKHDDVGHMKTRAAAAWLERRGFSTRLIERRIDENYRRSANEPSVAISGFDDNRPRHWLARAGFERIFDAGLGGEAHNFDTIAIRSWPNARNMEDLWPIEIDQERAAREQRRRMRVEANAGYGVLADNECGRLVLAGEAVAVPFVGAIAACIVVAEMLKCLNGIDHFSELKTRACLLGSQSPTGRTVKEVPPVRGLHMLPAAH